MKENNNVEKVIQAIQELKQLQNGHITTEKILFVCEQSPIANTDLMFKRDEITDQSESNMKAYADLFNQLEEGVVHYG